MKEQKLCNQIYIKLSRQTIPKVMVVPEPIEHITPMLGQLPRLPVSF